MPKIVNARELAESFDVSHTTIWEWAKEGMPVRTETENGKANEYDLAACIAWYARRAVSKAGAESAKDRLARLQGDKVERELRLMERELIEVKDIEPAIMQWLADHSAALDRVPEDWTDAIVAVGADPMAVHHVLKDIVRQLKEGAANYDFGTCGSTEDPAADLHEAA